MSLQVSTIKTKNAESALALQTNSTTRLEIASGGLVTVTGAVSATNTAKAWIHFNGVTADSSSNMTGVGASYNVSSLVEFGTGKCTINFATHFADGNYAVVGAAGGNPTTADYSMNLNIWGQTYYAVSVTTNRTDNEKQDTTLVNVAVFGN